MKKLILLFMFLFSLTTTFAQKGAVAITGGITQEGYAGLISYNYYWNRYNSNFIQGSLFLNFSEQEYDSTISVPYNDFTFNIGYFQNVIESRSGSFKTSIGAGVLFGYEAINNGSVELDNGALITSKSGFIYGAFAGVDVDFYLSDKTSLVLKANQYYHANSELGNFLPYVGGGVRIFLDF